MSSGNKMNCAPCATARSARPVARLRFASTSWSTDGICTTARRTDRAADGPAEFGTCAAGCAQDIRAVTKSTTAKRSIFIEARIINRNTDEVLDGAHTEPDVSQSQQVTMTPQASMNRSARITITNDHRSKVLTMTISSVAPLNEARDILRPPDKHASGQRGIFGEPHDRLRDLVGGKQFGWYAAHRALGWRE